MAELENGMDRKRMLVLASGVAIIAILLSLVIWILLFEEEEQKTPRRATQTSTETNLENSETATVATPSSDATTNLATNTTILAQVNTTTPATSQSASTPPSTLTKASPKNTADVPKSNPESTPSPTKTADLQPLPLPIEEDLQPLDKVKTSAKSVSKKDRQGAIKSANDFAPKMAKSQHPNPIKPFRDKQNIIVKVKDAQGAIFESAPGKWHVAKTAKKIADSFWQTLLVHRERKFESTLAPAQQSKNDAAQDWIWDEIKDHVVIHFPHVPQVQGVLQGGFAAQENRYYAIQFRTYERDELPKALLTLRELNHQGYYAYLLKIEEAPANEQWYRLRVGFFASEALAEQAGSEIYLRHHKQLRLDPHFFVSRVGTREMDIKILGDSTYQSVEGQGAWVVEALGLDSFEQCLQWIDAVYTPGLLLEASTRKDGRVSQYRLRMGSFTSQELAENYRKSLQPQVIATHRLEVSNIHAP